jgi:hypothetical protein
MTLPEATLALLAIVTVPTLKPALVIDVLADACVIPTTFGTATCAGPELTVKFTAEAGVTIAAGAGLWLTTLPEATVALLAIVTVPTVKPAPVIDEVAAVWVSPTTFGTATCGAGLGPLSSEPPQAASTMIARETAERRTIRTADLIMPIPSQLLLFICGADSGRNIPR